jgi:hypothetical protein
MAHPRAINLSVTPMWADPVSGNLVYGLCLVGRLCGLRLYPRCCTALHLFLSSFMSFDMRTSDVGTTEILWIPRVF